ncbi:hypothetical protein CORC01_08392 [Colletotrichum orchidophilum]|uniref:Aminoglycoside phosphotransferase domain-containing protein n=1 Tax=Colletotrichum orchidophilum TaxID=1209926 RepID=A0A1G4B4G5_9PEZI|nr:uncharacterized protein CORC01_08392 [Colletotrichum orchidophilum]OHE96320.1 hypothetical protein CORC01_08392 [Colletotrichum orchidophilum]
MAGVDIKQRVLEYRKTFDGMTPGIFWGTRPSAIEAIRYPEPLLPLRSFKLTFDAPPKPGVPKQLLIDIKFGPGPVDGGVFVNSTSPVRNTSTFDTAGRCQEVARAKIPGLVPRVIRVGVVELDDGDVDYIVTEHIPNTVTLDKVWSSLTPETQRRIMDQLVAAMKRSHHAGAEAHRLFNLAVHHGCSPCLSPRVDRPDGSFYISFSNTDSAMPDQKFTKKHIQQLAKHTVLCHMDLEPRNILVKLVEQPAPAVASAPGSKPQKELQLAGIVSWPKATFAPFAMERGLKDALLGCQFNHDFFWYKLFVLRTKHLIPAEGSTQDRLLAAMITIRLASRVPDCNHPTPLHQQHFYDMEKLTLTGVFRDDWCRQPCAETHKSPSDAEYREMGNGIIRHLLNKQFQTIPRHSFARHPFIENILGLESDSDDGSGPCAEDEAHSADGLDG